MSLKNIVIIVFALIHMFSAFVYAKQDNATVLTALKTTEDVLIDGVGDEVSWKIAMPLNVTVSDGSIGKIEVTMQSIYDTRYIYFLIKWYDPTRDDIKKQWVFDKKWVRARTCNVLEEDILLNEDRFSIMWNINDSVTYFNTAGCAVLCHGDRMFTNSPKERVDIWHWKAARTNPLGYADDKWLDNKISPQYTKKDLEAAHHGDKRNKNAGLPGLGGNYVSNMQEINVKGEMIKLPMYWKPNAKGDDRFFITQDEILNGEAVKVMSPLSIHDTEPIPGYILFRPIGSRGDIDAKGVWADDTWTLEIRRKLFTGNDDDVQFDISKLYRFGIAIMDNAGGFSAYGIGHSFDLGARTLEFGGVGSEAITTMALVRDYLEIALVHSNKQKFGIARSEINMALAVFNTAQRAIASKDPDRYLNIKSKFTLAKRRPSINNIEDLIQNIDSAILILQGKISPARASLIQKTLVTWGEVQIYVFFMLGLAALFPVYRSVLIRRKVEFRTMGTFLFIVLIPIVLESVGRLGMLLNIMSLQKLSFMTSEYATLLWAFLMCIALFIGRMGFVELDKALNLLKRQKESLTEQKKKLEEISLTDELTKIYNRRYFNQRLSEYFAMSLRYGNPVALLLLDIDYFKKVNDNYGHQCGDIVLQEVAVCIKNSARVKVDIPARYGGEEFALLLFNTDMEGAIILAERLRQDIEKITIKCDEHTVKVTVSIGISYMPSSTVMDEECVIKEADEALYEAKSSGRNCIKTYKGSER